MFNHLYEQFNLYDIMYKDTMLLLRILLTSVLVYLSVHVITYCWTTPLASSLFKASHWKVTLVDVVSMTMKFLGGTFGEAGLEHTKTAYRCNYSYATLYFVIKETFNSLLNTKTVIMYIL